MPVDVKRNTIVYVNGADLSKRGEHRIRRRFAIAQKIHIACRAVRIIEPSRHQHRTLENEPIAMGRKTEPMLQSFVGITRQQEVKGLPEYILDGWTTTLSKSTDYLFKEKLQESSYVS